MRDLTLLPRTSPSYEALAAAVGGMDMDSPRATQHVLATGGNGSISLITPLSVQAYRTLTALQAYMMNTLPHPLGLNPRGFRLAEADASVGGRLIIDGDILKRWMDLGSWKRIDGMSKAGVDSEWELRMLLEGVGVRGLGYL